VRLLADDPNFVERAADALLLLESLERMKLIEAAARALATVDRPARHTGLVEKCGLHWYAVDLFPRRNASGRNLDWGNLTFRSAVASWRSSASSSSAFFSVIAACRSYCSLRSSTMVAFVEHHPDFTV
jgi:hypothetical protein